MTNLDAPKALTITLGDMTLLNLKEGAMVNPSNTGLILGSGVSEMIARRAGPFFQQKLHTVRSGLPGNRLEPGRAVDTEPGQLACKRLIHTSLLGKKKVDKKLVANALLAVYDLADELELKEVAIPPLGTGVGKFPFDDFLEIFWQITIEELPRAEHVEHVILCLYDEGEFAKAEAYAKEHEEDAEEELITLESTRSNMWSGLA